MNLFRRKTLQSILEQAEINSATNNLKRSLKVKDLIAFGIAAIVGAGIFGTIGKASFDGGPGVIFLFIFTAIACGFSAYAYAEFASMVPVAGSAYTYSYVAFGEVVAWLIGWSLIMEYSIGNIAVAISWSDYFTGFLAGFKINIPAYLTTDYSSASSAFDTVTETLRMGGTMNDFERSVTEGYAAWINAPTIFGFHIIFDLPALLIIVAITALVYRGIEETKRASNIMVFVKLIVILLVIAVGAFYVKPENWNPFMPNGASGVLKGISSVFFAYIGFDAISTTAEECENPQRDLPRGMMWSIAICTVLYIAIALVLTGMVSYTKLNVGDPLAFVFKELNVAWLSGIISLSAIVAITSVLLVFQLGQPRIWLSMSRDGLLPKAFSKVHPKFKTPSYATIVTGIIVAVPALFMNLTMVTDLCSIGTLFAFTLVCAGVLRLQNDPNKPASRFKIPYMNAKYVYPILIVIGTVIMVKFNNDGVKNFMTSNGKVEKENFMNGLVTSRISEIERAFELDERKVSLVSYISNMNQKQYETFIAREEIYDNEKSNDRISVFFKNIPTWFFLIALLILAYRAFKNNYSMIPLMGLTSCLYMMSEMGMTNWVGFTIWLAVGLVIYFGYSYNNSVLQTDED
ncbi:MAG: amino acid permease [Bacteroidia bacterium]|nr:amino acid permease [Bacteroidia bacterium]